MQNRTENNINKQYYDVTVVFDLPCESESRLLTMHSLIEYPLSKAFRQLDITAMTTVMRRTRIPMSADGDIWS